MPPKGSKVSSGPAHLGDRVGHVVGEDLDDAGAAARRGGAEVGQPAVVGLDAGPAALVVLGRGGQRDQVPLGEEGGDRVGKEHLGRNAVGLGLGETPRAVPIAVGDRREQVGERIHVRPRPRHRTRRATGWPDTACSPECRRRHDRRPRRPCNEPARARSPSSAQGRRWKLPGADGVGPAVQHGRRLLEPVSDDEVAPLHAPHTEAAELAQVHDVDRPTRRLQLRLELLEGGAGCRRPRAFPLQGLGVGCAGRSRAPCRAGHPRDRRRRPAGPCRRRSVDAPTPR